MDARFYRYERETHGLRMTGGLLRFYEIRKSNVVSPRHSHSRIRYPQRDGKIEEVL